MNCIYCGQAVKKGALLCRNCAGKKLPPPVAEPPENEKAAPSGRQSARLISASGGRFASKSKKKRNREPSHSTGQSNAPMGAKPPAQSTPHPHSASRGTRTALILCAVLCLLLVGAVAMLTVRLIENRSALSAARADAERLPQVESERDSLIADLSERDASLESAQAIVQDQSLQITSLQTSLEEAESTGAQAGEQLSSAKKQLNDLTAEQKEAAKKVKEQEEALEKASQEKAELESRVDSLSNEVDGLNDEIDSLNDELDTCYGKIDALNRTITQYDTRNTFFNRYVGFVCPGDNQYYHRYGCSRLSLTGSWRVVRIDTTSSYLPCPDCK